VRENKFIRMLELYSKVAHNVVDTNSMINNLKLATAISDQLLQQLRDFLDRQADMVVGGNDPAQPAEPNDAARLVLELDAATDGQFR
jgi:hypothetical protein